MSKHLKSGPDIIDDIKIIVKKLIAATEDTALSLLSISLFFTTLFLGFLFAFYIDYLDYQDSFWAKFIDYSFPKYTMGIFGMNFALAIICTIYLKYKFKYSNKNLTDLWNRPSFYLFPPLIYIWYMVNIGPIFL